MTEHIDSAHAPPGDDERLIRRADVLWRTAIHGVLLLPPSASRPLLVTMPAGIVWSALSQTRSRAELANIVREAFGLDPHQARHDADVVVDAFIENEVVAVVVE